MKIRNKLTAICLTVILGMPMRVLAGEAAESGRAFPRASLGTCEVGISGGDGRLIVVYSTSCRGTAGRIGVRNMVLETKEGLLWKKLVIRSEFSEDTDAYYGGFIISGLEEGKTYRVHGTHYAVQEGVETSVYSETGKCWFGG